MLKLAYSEDTGDLTNKPPLDYSHRDITLSPREHQEMTQAILESRQSTEPSEYQPTSRELSQWMAAAERRRDTEQALRVIQIKSSLEATYKEATGNLFDDPPEDYSHPDVTLNQDQRDEMSRAILENQASRTTEVGGSPRKQVEIG